MKGKTLVGGVTPPYVSAPSGVASPSRAIWVISTGSKGEPAKNRKMPSVIPDTPLMPARATTWL